MQDILPRFARAATCVEHTSHAKEVPVKMWGGKDRKKACYMLFLGELSQLSQFVYTQNYRLFVYGLLVEENIAHNKLAGHNVSGDRWKSLKAFCYTLYQIFISDLICWQVTYNPKISKCTF